MPNLKGSVMQRWRIFVGFGHVGTFYFPLQKKYWYIKFGRAAEMRGSVMGYYTHENIPKDGGLWFPLIQPMWQFYANKGCGKECLCVTWDKNGKSSKAFGIFESAEAYFHTIYSMPPSKRCGYEIVNQNSPCKLYFDVGWETMGPDTAAL